MENHCVFKFSLFLRVSYIFAINYSHIHVHCSFLPSSLPTPFSICPSTKIRVLCLFIFNNPLNSDSGAHVCMGMGPSTGTWSGHLCFSPLSAPSDYLYLLSNGLWREIIYSINVVIWLGVRSWV